MASIDCYLFPCLINISLSLYLYIYWEDTGPCDLETLLSIDLTTGRLSPEKAMATHSSTLVWKIPWMEEPGRLQSMGSLRVGHDWETSLSLFTFMHWRRKWQLTPVFLPGESQGWGSLVGCHPRGLRVGHDWSYLAAAAADYHQSWANLLLYLSCYCCSVSQSCLNFCNLMECSTLGFPVLHCLLEFAQTHDHWFSDAIQPSPSLSPTSPVLNLSQHQGLSSESALCIRWPKNWNFSISPSFQWIFRVDFIYNWLV